MKSPNSFRLLLLFCFTYLFLSDTSELPWNSCSSDTYSVGSSYSNSLNEVASALINASSSFLYSFVNSTSTPKAYGMFQCRGDISLKDCFLCVNKTMGSVLQQQICSTSKGGNILQEYCHVRYDNRSSLFDGTSPDLSFLFSDCNTQQNSDAEFTNDILTALPNVTRSAPNNTNHYAITHHGLVYALAQCDGYLSYSQCSSCLLNYLDVIGYCDRGIGAGVYYGSCFYLYKDYLFYADSSLPPSTSPASIPSPPFDFPTPLPPFVPNTSHSASSISTGTIAGTSVAGIILVGLVVGILLLFYRCQKKDGVGATQGPRLGLGQDFKPFFSSAVAFSYEDLRVATLDFHPDNKLGQGGFGSVYKGRLADYREVAIKKLSTTSKQGKPEFMNEVSIITSVQHKNLIKLYGCCAEGSERLLVYEFLPNKSLDLFLFDGSSNTHVLNWKPRFDIVLGIARGLAYLHHDSQVRIIHRDIKPSNILLADDLTPKIADFGLAQLFSDHITHITIGAAGTVGYLSPEYAMGGQLTEKVDVYSYGVLALEIVSGRRNSDFTQPKEKQHLLDWAWNCYNEGEQLQLLDPRLSHDTPPAEIFRVIHVALLCVQSSPSDRPSMSKVIHLLSGKTVILDRPIYEPVI